MCLCIYIYIYIYIISVITNFLQSVTTKFILFLSNALIVSIVTLEVVFESSLVYP